MADLLADETFPMDFWAQCNTQLALKTDPPMNFAPVPLSWFGLKEIDNNPALQADVLKWDERLPLPALFEY